MTGRGIWNSEEWKRLEQALSVLDPDLERFAAAHGMSLGRNHHDCPERSLAWRSGGIDRLVVNRHFPYLALRIAGCCMSAVLEERIREARRNA